MLEMAYSKAVGQLPENYQRPSRGLPAEEGSEWKERRQAAYDKKAHRREGLDRASAKHKHKATMDVSIRFPEDPRLSVATLRLGASAPKLVEGVEWGNQVDLQTTLRWLHEVPQLEITLPQIQNVSSPKVPKASADKIIFQ